MKKIRTVGCAAMIAALLVASSHASIVNVFLDAGEGPGSTSTAAAYHGLTEATWDVPVTEESGLSGFGAAVMEVHFVGMNVNGNPRRGMYTGGGMGIDTGASAWVMDGATREGAIFQLRFYADASKTAEITGLGITLNSATAYVVGTAAVNCRLDAFASSKVLTTDASYAYLNGIAMHASTDTGNAFAEDRTMYPTGAGTGSTGYYAMNPVSTITFDEDDTFFVRRIGGTSPYRLNAVSFDVVPEPATLGLFALIGGGIIWIRKRFTI